MIGCPSSSCYLGAILSNDPARRYLPSGENATELRLVSATLIVRRAFSPSTDQRRTVPSPLPVASIFPSGEKAKERTKSLWPEKECTSSPLLALNSSAPRTYLPPIL